MCRIFLFVFALASRLAVHVIKWSKTLPDPDHFKHSVVISVIIHGSSLALLSLSTYALWVAIAVCGNVAHQLLFKLTQFGSISSGIVLPAIQKFPITVGFLLVSLAYGSCGGLAIICAVIMYFIILSKMYEDYLEEFVFKTAAVITGKLFGKKNPASVQNSSAAGERISALAITQPKKDAAKSTKDDSNAKKPTEAPVDEPTTSNHQQSAEKMEDAAKTTEVTTEVKTRVKAEPTAEVKTEVQTEHKTEVKTEAKIRETKKSAKKVEFQLSDDEQASTSSDMNSSESKTNLDVKIDGDAIVKSSSQESFELLYSQLDPDDVAMFTQKDEPEEMTEEQRLELEKAEAGVYHIEKNHNFHRDPN